MEVARMLGTSHCPEASTGRLAIAPQLSSDVVQQHDISLCNLLGLGNDYVYVPVSNRLFVLANPVGNGILVLMSIFVVYLMVVIGHNIQVVLGVSSSSSSSSSQQQQKSKISTTKTTQEENDNKQKKKMMLAKKKRSNAQWTVASMIALLLLACFCTGTSNVLGTFVTVQDQAVFIATLVHVSYYCLRVEINVYFGDGRRSNPVNPMLASILAAVQRIYGSIENPYSQTILFIMLAWVLHKMSMLGMRVSEQNHQPSQILWWRSMDIFADCILISVMLYAGVGGQASSFSSSTLFVFVFAKKTDQRVFCCRWKWNPISLDSSFCKAS